MIRRVTVLSFDDAGLAPSADHRRIFTHQDGSRWTSQLFRESFLYPALEAQRLEGDAYLQRFDGSPGNSLAAYFWSLHSYRRGSRTHVSRQDVSIPGFRIASLDEVYEHARWRRPRLARLNPLMSFIATDSRIEP